MAIYEGTIPGVESITLRLDQLKTLLNTYLADIFALDSDIGEGDARVLTYLVPFSQHKLCIKKGEYPNHALYYRNIADTGVIDVTNQIITDYSAAIKYSILKNTNSGFFVCISGATYNGIFWSRTANSEWYSSLFHNGFGTHLESAYAINNDTVLPKTNTLAPVYSLPVSDGRELMLPFYAPGGNGTYLYTTPLADIRIWRKPITPGLFNRFFIDGVPYIALTNNTNLCIKVE